MTTRMIHCALLAVPGLLIALAADDAHANDIITFRGTSDASAGVFLDAEQFVVADDENNVLKIYKISQPSQPVALCDLSTFLRTNVQNPEADIEGAARIGNRIYWITSHGRNKDGKERPNRYRFFATEIRTAGDAITLIPAGMPCLQLVPALLRTPFAQSLGLHQATRLGQDLNKKERQTLAPKEQGLNIEALAASPDGTMYIGFRNPLPPHPFTRRPQALVVPLTNYRQVVDISARPEFGRPILWDFDGLGLRSMDYVPAHKAFFIVAGPIDEDGDFVLYRWSGDRNQLPLPVRKFDPGLTPEALMSAPDGKRLFILSDDGSRLVRISNPAECMPGELVDERTCRNKHLIDPTKRTFRAFFITP